MVVDHDPDHVARADAIGLGIADQGQHLGANDDRGGLVLRPIVDSAAVGTVPVGGVQTGGGFLASFEDSTGTPPTVPTELR